MEEGTIKTPDPKCRLYWCFCLGWCSNFVGFESETECYTFAEYGLQHNSTPPPPLPQPHTAFLYIYNVRLLWKGGGGVGEVREKVEGQQFTRGVENTNMTDCISCL